MTDHPSDRYAAGAAKIAEVYPGSVTPMPEGASGFNDVLLRGLFGEVWTRPELPIRDRRLLIMGAIATHGSKETWELQAKSALANGELTAAELRETLVTLASYAGYPNVAPLVGLTERVIAAYEADNES